MTVDPWVILHLLGRLEVGGAERMLLSLCRAMPQEQYSQSVVALSGRSGRLTGEFASAGVPEIRCGMTPRFSFPYRLCRVLRQLQPDVVVSHVSLASGFLLMLARLSGVGRRIAVLHSDADGRGGTMRRCLYRKTMRWLLAQAATDVVGVTESTLSFSGVRGHAVPSQVVPNGVDTEIFRLADRSAARQRLKLPTTGTVVVHVGRAAPEKNRQALPMIVRAMPGRPTLALAGAACTDDLDLDPSDELWSRTRNFGLLSDIRDLLWAGDLLVLPSVREGLPLVLLEALACGRPVVSSDLPGIRQVAANLPDVHLVDRDATPETFAAEIMRVQQTKRAEDDIRQSLLTAGHGLDKAVIKWMELCRPRGQGR